MRVQSEMKRLNKTLDERLDNIHIDINSEIEALSANVNSITDTVQHIETWVHTTESESSESPRAFNVVIRKLPETVNENVMDKVNRVIKDHMKVADVTVSTARRIPNLNDNNLSTPGVVIASFRTSEDHSKVMKDKSNLRDYIFQ